MSRFLYIIQFMALVSSLVAASHSSHVKRASCVNPDPHNTLVDRINKALNSSGDGYVLSLCPNTNYPIDGTLIFAAKNQEISTQGYPTDGSRAMITIASGIKNGTGLATAIQGNCGDCDNIRLRNVQINGSRVDTFLKDGGANIEMGGSNSGQVVEYVRSFSPRGWSCLHIAEGGLSCANATVQNNDIGPCGTDTSGEWADGISFACSKGNVRNNMINNPTDGGIVLFGAPGTLVENNTIWIENNTLLGGINMVDYLPWNGNYSNTVVRNNTILGGFADDGKEDSQTKGNDQFDVFIKIGIAIGPRTWFGARSLSNTSFNGTVQNNQLSGAFGYGIAIASATNFTVQGNTLVGNTTFIGSKGQNCTNTDNPPTAQDYIFEKNTTKSASLQKEFTGVDNGNDLVCLVAPTGGSYWPYGDTPDTESDQSTSGGSEIDAGSKAGIAVGVILGILFVAALAWYVRRWALQRSSPIGFNNRRARLQGFQRGNF